MALPDRVRAPGCRIDEGAIVGYVWSDDPPPTVLGEGCIVRAQAIVYAGATLGARCHVGHGAVIRQGSRLGDDCSVGTRTILEHEVTLGDRVRIHSGAFIPELTVIEDDAWIGPMVCVTNAPYPMMGPRETRLSGVTIRRAAKIGAASVLLPGIVIGEESLVGAGSVVTKDVPPGVVVAGNPARVIGSTDDARRKADAR